MRAAIIEKEKVMSNCMEKIVVIPLTRDMQAIIDARFAGLVRRNSWYAQPGQTTFYAHRSTYANGKRRAIALHRLIWEQVFGEIPEDKEIDHRNGNGLDNRLDNLHLVSRRKNLQNKAAHRNGKLPGASHRRWGWESHLKWLNKAYYLGTFQTEQQAHDAYEDALTRLEAGEPVESVCPGKRRKES